MYYGCTSTLPPQLSSQMGSSSEERGRLEELGSEVAQLRERMSEVDRAVTALTNTGIHEHMAMQTLVSLQNNLLCYT